ncbi:MAG: hypothetical protein LBH68_05070 [Bifidobacteriaceae bacterium]|nr:hypothetical protein [Bifidobacteriaceae bacterium]
MDLGDIQLISGAEGRHLLDQLPPYEAALAVKLLDGLRKRGIDPKMAAAALTQSRLRTAARTKFGPFADQMLFTEAGLQQSTRLSVAAHHAARYLRAEVGCVADLTGGIGGDVLAMAGLGLRVICYEQDPVTAAVARANLAAFPEVKVIQADSLEADLTGADALYADPSRRTQAGRRIFDPAAYQPPLQALLELAQNRPLGVKVGPGLPHSAIPAAAEAQWVSVDGTVVEAGLWFGPLRQVVDAAAGTSDTDGPFRTALVMRGSATHRLAEAGELRLAAGPLDEFIYEPDGAVIRAHLLAEAAAELADPHLVAPNIAYITSHTELATSPFLAGYRVVDHFPFGLKRLAAYLRERSIGELTIKKRGTAVEPAELRKRLKLKGDGSMVAILTRLGTQQSVVVVEALGRKP